MIGTKLSHYEISAAIGAGGMGLVYRAVDARLNRTVALKVLPADAVADPERRQRFVLEARAASALSHPNIVTIHDIDQDGGIDFLVMELVSGQPLAQLIPKEGLPIGRAIDWAMQIASALEAAQAVGVIHRDIKPGNIMVTESDQVKVLDFGLAKRLDRVVDQTATTMMAVEAASEAGLVMGTVAYMSPEQAQGLPFDGRTDIFSFGAVLHEMLTGRPAFTGGTPVSTLAAVLGERPVSPDTIRKDVPPDLARLVQDCLIKDRALRPTARVVVQRLTALRAAWTGTRVDVAALFRRRAVLMTAALTLLIIGAGGAWWWKATSHVRWTRNVALPEIQRLSALDDYDGMYRLAREAILILSEDPQLKQLWLDMTMVVPSIESSPPGADVAVKGYLGHDRDWIPLGRTPLESVHVPFGAVLVRLTKDGLVPVESMLGLDATYTLHTPEATPPGMIFVPPTVVTLGPISMELTEFWIDRFEVTNKQFKEFVDRGGYRSREYWTDPIVDEDRTLSWDEAMTLFRDTTGRPGPATWELGTYPEGQDDMPVGGVSWYEAAAYAAFAGKSLPTAHHWRNAAIRLYSRNFADILNVSNFSGKGPAPVGSYKGIAAAGAYDMAGNVKEWCWNEARGGRVILGGAWDETSYMFNDPDAQPPLQRRPTYGFRLAKYIASPPNEAMAPLPYLVRDFTSETPVADAAFEILRGLYRYDPTALNSAVEQQEDAPAWRRETVGYDAAYGGERIRAYLYLPTNAQPPYQTVLYFPGGDAALLQSSRDLRLRMVDFVIRSGRALLFPVYKGTYERQAPATGPNARRDLTIARVKDMQRSVDYLMSRPDVDKNRVAFYGLSLGAYNGIIFTAVESRLAASVISGGCMTAQKLAPEVELLNFAPRVRVPTLMVNGRSDFSCPYETSQVPLFRYLGPPADQKLHVTREGGHIPVRIHETIREILDWFDRRLGPVDGGTG